MIQAWQNFLKASINSQQKVDPSTPSGAHPSDSNLSPLASDLNADVRNDSNLEGIINLDSYGLIRVSGDDAMSFLQGQLTCDVNLKTNPNLCFGSYCNLKGRVIAFFRICFWQNSYYLCLPKELINDVIAELNKYILIAKVSVEDVSNSNIIVGLLGKTAIDYAVNYFNENKIGNENDKQNNGRENKENTAPFFNYGDASVLIQNLEHSIALAYFKDLEEAKSFWLSLHINSPTLTTNEWHLANIQSKIPEIFTKSSGEFLPHNINLPQISAVSFNKGCYRGQEIISRMEYKATIKKALKVMSISIADIKKMEETTNIEAGMEINAGLNAEKNIDLNTDTNAKVVNTASNGNSELIVLVEANI